MIHRIGTAQPRRRLPGRIRRLLARLLAAGDHSDTFCCDFHERRARAQGVIGGNRWPL